MIAVTQAHQIEPIARKKSRQVNVCGQINQHIIYGITKGIGNWPFAPVIGMRLDMVEAGHSAAARIVAFCAINLRAASMPVASPSS